MSNTLNECEIEIIQHNYRITRRNTCFFTNEDPNKLGKQKWAKNKDRKKGN